MRGPVDCSTPVFDDDRGLVVFSGVLVGGLFADGAGLFYVCGSGVLNGSDGEDIYAGVCQRGADFGVHDGTGGTWRLGWGRDRHWGWCRNRRRECGKGLGFGQGVVIERGDGTEVGGRFYR